MPKKKVNKLGEKPALAMKREMTFGTEPADSLPVVMLPMKVGFASVKGRTTIKLIAEGRCDCPPCGKGIYFKIEQEED